MELIENQKRVKESSVTPKPHQF